MSDGQRVEPVKLAVSRHVKVEDSGVHLTDLHVPDARVAAYFQSLPEAEWDDRAKRAMSVGVLCLERANTQADVDFLRKEVQHMVASMRTTIQDFSTDLVGKLGTEDGQVLKPVKDSITSSSEQVDKKLKEVQAFLRDDVDPEKQGSVLARAMQSVKTLVDPNNKESLQFKLDESIRSATKEDGVFAERIKLAVAEAVKPLATEMDKLTKQLSGEAMVEEALQYTTASGRTMEDEVVETLSAWGQPMGLQVTHIGVDNQPGDVLLKFPSVSAADHEESIIIEVRDRQDPWGRQRINDHLDKAMAKREARSGIFLTRDRAGLGKEIGEWGEGIAKNGPWVATTLDLLMVAIRALRIQMRLETIQATQPEVDVSAALGQLQRIRVSINKIKNIHTKVTVIKKGADDVASTADDMKKEVLSALLEIESALRVTPDDMPPVEGDDGT